MPLETSGTHDRGGQRKSNPTLPASVRRRPPDVLLRCFVQKSVITPTRRTLSGCCARAASGQAAALPSPAMNSRRRIRDLLSLLCVAAYRGQGRVGTGCIPPRGQPPASFFAARAAAFGPLPPIACVAPCPQLEKADVTSRRIRLLATVPKACRRKPPSGIPLAKQNSIFRDLGHNAKVDIDI